jgi:hypothetical protein
MSTTSKQAGHVDSRENIFFERFKMIYPFLQEAYDRYLQICLYPKRSTNESVPGKSDYDEMVAMNTKVAKCVKTAAYFLLVEKLPAKVKLQNLCNYATMIKFLNDNQKIRQIIQHKHSVRSETIQNYGDQFEKCCNVLKGKITFITPEDVKSVAEKQVLEMKQRNDLYKDEMQRRGEPDPQKNNPYDGRYIRSPGYKYEEFWLNKWFGHLEAHDIAEIEVGVRQRNYACMFVILSIYDWGKQLDISKQAKLIKSEENDALKKKNIELQKDIEMQRQVLEKQRQLLEKQRQTKSTNDSTTKLKQQVKAVQVENVTKTTQLKLFDKFVDMINFSTRLIDKLKQTMDQNSATSTVKIEENDIDLPTTIKKIGNLITLCTNEMTEANVKNLSDYLSTLRDRKKLKIPLDNQNKTPIVSTASIASVLRRIKN